MKSQADYLAHVRMLARTQPHIAREALAWYSQTLNWLKWPSFDEMRQAAMKDAL